MLNGFKKPPSYSSEEQSERRRKIGLGLMGMYKAFGWLQPVGDEWTLEVNVWAAALAFIPTAALLGAFSDAIAQPRAPKPLTPEYLKRVYFGVQEGEEVPHYCLAFKPTNEPARLCLPPGPAPDPDEARAAAEARAAELTANIEDPDLRAVFQRIAKASLLPRDLRQLATPEEVEAAQRQRDDEARRRAGAVGTSGRDYMASLRESGGLPEWLRDDLARARPQCDAVVDGSPVEAELQRQVAV